jgi:hypothetical protein
MEMGLFDILERFGLPVAMVVALGWYVKAQNTWIQNELQIELRESFERLEGINIKLIDAIKKMQIALAEKESKISAIIEIMASLSGNGLKEKFIKKDNDRGW